MNKVFFLIFSCCLLMSNNVSAQMKNYTNIIKKAEAIKVTGYMDYPPFGYIQEERNDYGEIIEYTYHSVFEDILNDLKNNSNVKISYIFSSKQNTEQFISDINSGKIDIFLGAYNDTKRFKRTELVFPSILNNPVTVITMPETAAQLKDLNQLKQMRGAVCNQDEFSDYVKRQMNEYQLEYVETPYQLFEKLYTGEVDFVFTTQYFGIIEAAKLGIRDYLSFSKQIVWNMPIFIGISQLSPNRKFLSQKLSSYSENPEHKIKLEKKLQDLIYEIELKNRGVVPPAFIKKENSNNSTSSLDLLSQEDKI